MNRAPLFVLACFLAFGCEEKKEAAQPAAPSAPTAPAAAAPSAAATAPAASGQAAAPSGAAAAPSGDKGDVKGTVTVTGKVPAMEDLKRNSDAFCAKKQMKDESVIAGKKGELANVVVHINGLPATPAPATKATLSQDDCMYIPHVQGIVDGQKLEIRNGDPVLHNVHTYEGARTLFNVAQVPGTPNIEKTFEQKQGVMLKFKCDVHQWMTGYVWVQNNGYFAVTDKDGKFEIKDVPVGTWDIEAWHERFGSKAGKVTVAKGKPAEVKFEFNGSETASAANK
jgi:plastocyanin